MKAMSVQSSTFVLILPILLWFKITLEFLEQRYRYIAKRYLVLCNFSHINFTLVYIVLASVVNILFW